MTITNDLLKLAMAAGELNSSSFLRNRIINGDMRIDQRNAGASVVPSGFAYTLDRWCATGTVFSKVAVQQTVPGASGFSHCLTVTSQSAYSVAAGDLCEIQHRIEGYNISDFGFGAAGAKSITLSFWVKSSLTGTFAAAVQNDVPNRSYPFTYSIPTANTWTYITVTIPGDTAGAWNYTNTTGLQLSFTMGSGSTYQGTSGAWQAGNFTSVAGAVNLIGTNGATWSVTGVQLEVGTQATAFDRRLYAIEQILCQRYYASFLASMVAFNTTSLSGYVPWPANMRVNPTITISNGGVVNNMRTTSNGVVVSMSPVALGSDAVGISYIGSSTAPFTTDASYDFVLTVAAEL